MLSDICDVSVAKRFFKKMMSAEHRRLPFSISVDKNAAYPEAFSASQVERIVPMDCKLRRVKYLNSVIEQDHRFIKKKVRASQCFKSFHTAERTLEGIEVMNMMRKGQVKRLSGNDLRGQAKFVSKPLSDHSIEEPTQRSFAPHNKHCQNEVKLFTNNSLRFSPTGHLSHVVGYFQCALLSF